MENTFSIQESLTKLWDKLQDWLDALILKLPNIVMAALILVLFYFLAKGIRKIMMRFLLKRIKQRSIQEMIAKIVFVAILLLGFFFALGVLELDKLLTSILAGAGVIGLAIGLALQGTLSNTFGGLVLSFMKKLNINDYVEMGDIKGFVSEIDLRNIVIRRPDNNFIVIPNSNFIDNAYVNYSISSRSKITVECGVGYESDLSFVEERVREIIGKNFEQVNKEEIDFFYTAFGDSSINFMTRFWTDVQNSADILSATHKAIKLIKADFDSNDINIPFPIRTLDFAKNDLKIEIDRMDGDDKK